MELGSCAKLAVKDAEVEVSARRSKAATGDHPSGNRPGRPCCESEVRWKFVAEETAPGATETVIEPFLSEPPAELIGMAAAICVMRASTGTVPTPACRKTSRSTETIAGAPVVVLAVELMLRKRCALLEAIE